MQAKLPHPTVRIIFVASLLVLLEGCTSTYMGDNYIYDETIDTSQLLNINKIALLDVPTPSAIWLGSPSSGAVAGIFNPLISLAGASHTGDQVVDPRAIAVTIQNDTREWLEKAGIEVISVEAQRPHPSRMLRNYDQFNQIDVDAILEIGPAQIGFREEIGEVHFSEGELSPDVGLIFRLVRAKDGVVLVESAVHYSSFNYLRRGLVGTTLLGPASHKFADVDSVKRQPKEAIKRLSYAIKGATQHIATVVENRNNLKNSGVGTVTKNDVDVATTVTGNAAVGNGQYKIKTIGKSEQEILDLREGDPEKLGPDTEQANFANFPPPEFDLSGIYTSKFLPKHDVDYWCFDTKKTFMISLKQEGNGIKGTFLSGITGEIEGTITNKKVEFTWYTTRCNHGIKAEWTVDTGGSNLKGFGWSNLVWEAQKNN